MLGVRGGAVSWGTALQAGRSQVRFPMMSWEFFIDIFLQVALWPWCWLSLLQKWVPEKLPGGKGGRCVKVTILPPSCTVVMKSGNLNLLGPSGPLQACNGTALPLPYLICQIFSSLLYCHFNKIMQSELYFYIFKQHIADCKYYNRP